MNMTKITAALVLAGGTLVLAACSGSTPASDEAAIRDQNKKWLEAIVAKDATIIANIYAEDGAMFPPNAAKVAGREGLQKAWEGFTQIPGMALVFETDKIVIAKSGDLAVETQTYKFTTGEGAAQTTEVGKGVVTWVKRDGQWHVLTDMFSSDNPPPAASAVPAPPMDAPAIDPAAAGTTPAAPGTEAPAAPAPAAPTAPATPPAQ